MTLRILFENPDVDKFADFEIAVGIIHFEQSFLRLVGRVDTVGQGQQPDMEAFVFGVGTFDLEMPGFAKYTRILVVTLAEATPVHEAERLQADLARAGIAPFAWVINQSLLASGTRDPLLAQRGEYERPFIQRVAEVLAPRCALVPWRAALPTGATGLRGIVG